MKVLPLSYKPLDLCVARMTTQKGVKWCTLALNALTLKYKTAVFLTRGEVSCSRGRMPRTPEGRRLRSYSENFNMNLLEILAG